MVTGNAQGRTAFLARRAKEAKYYSLWRKLLILFIGTTVLFLTMVYIGSAMYSRFGSFTVTVNKYDASKLGLSLSETPDFDMPTSRLNARSSEDITCISVHDLPDDLDSINGEHSGLNYLAYTYYMKNVGEYTVTYEYHLYITDVQNDLDKAIRIRLYKDGEPTTYARTRADGMGAEEGCVDFMTERTVVRAQCQEFNPGDVTKFTVVVWIEGDDPECLDDLLGGSLKTDMSIQIVQSEQPTDESDK